MPDADELGTRNHRPTPGPIPRTALARCPSSSHLHHVDHRRRESTLITHQSKWPSTSRSTRRSRPRSTTHRPPARWCRATPAPTSRCRARRRATRLASARAPAEDSSAVPRPGDERPRGACRDSSLSGRALQLSWRTRSHHVAQAGYCHRRSRGISSMIGAIAARGRPSPRLVGLNQRL